MLNINGRLHDSGIHPCELGQGQYEWQTPCCTHNYLFLRYELTVLGIYLCDLALHFFRMSWFPRRLLRPSCKQNLGGRVIVGALQACLGPIWILEQRSPGLKPGLSCINTWNVKCKDKNCEMEEWLLLTGKVKEDIRQVIRERLREREKFHCWTLFYIVAQTLETS